VGPGLDAGGALMPVAPTVDLRSRSEPGRTTSSPARWRFGGNHSRPQGGFHIWGAVRANAAVNPTGVEIHYSVRKGPPATDELSNNTYRLNSFPMASSTSGMGCWDCCQTRQTLTARRSDCTWSSRTRAAEPRSTSAR